jgi:O-antigen/teichoic acid export membrane protein
VKYLKVNLKQFLGKIKSIIIHNQVLVKNFSFLSILQLTNLLIPLITYPYLIRVLGKEIYGLVVFAQAIVGYLLILVSFGFNISATKAISIHRENKEKISEIVSSIFIIKAGLFFVSFLILILGLSIIPQAKGFELLFYLTMWLCINDIIFPIWYFQGIEQMKYITYISSFSRLLFIGLIFIFVNSPKDFLNLPMINGLGAIISGIISLFIIFNKHQINFKFQSYKTLRYYFNDSIPIFISNVSIRLYVSTNKVIIGAFLGMTEVAYYDLGEKIVSIMKIPQSLLSQTIFPKINKEKNINFIKKVFKISVFTNIILFIGVIVFSKFIVLLLGGNEMIDATWVVNILAISVPIIAISNIFGIQILIPFGKQKLFSQIIISSGLIYIIQILLIWIIWEINIYSVSIITVTTEIFISITMYYYCKKSNLW